MIYAQNYSVRKSGEFTDIPLGNLFGMASANLHDGFSDKKYIFKYTKISEIGAMLR
jgi:hypothetical protein